MDYSSIQNHRSMFFDDLRNSYYLKAIQKIVKKNSIALDLGAGLGIHGFMANSCGAKKVYLVDPAPILDITKMVVKENELTEQIECISDKIEKVTLADKVDVIISVFTGNFLLTEDLLPSLFYARDKYLRPGGQMIPDRAKMIVVPVSASDYYTRHIDSWSKPLQNIDFSIARKYAVNSLYYDSPENREIDFFAEPADLLELDFMVAKEASCNNKIEIKVTKDGTIHGWIGWFDVKIGDEWLSTSPKDKQTHWRQVFLPMETPLNVKKNDIVSFELSKPEYGEWSWIIEYQNERQKHSTFLSKPLKLKNLSKQTENHCDTLSEKGKAVQNVLQQLNSTNSIVRIASEIYKVYPTLFTNKNETTAFVKNIVEKYC